MRTWRRVREKRTSSNNKVQEDAKVNSEKVFDLMRLGVTMFAGEHCVDTSRNQQMEQYIEITINMLRVDWNIHRYGSIATRLWYITHVWCLSGYFKITSNVCVRLDVNVFGAIDQHNGFGTHSCNQSWALERQLADLFIVSNFGLIFKSNKN